MTSAYWCVRRFGKVVRHPQGAPVVFTRRDAARSLRDNLNLVEGAQVPEKGKARDAWGLPHCLSRLNDNDLRHA